MMIVMKICMNEKRILCGGEIMWWTYQAILECKNLYYKQKKSISEIASIFNTTEESVCSILGIKNQGNKIRNLFAFER